MSTIHDINGPIDWIRNAPPTFLIAFLLIAPGSASGAVRRANTGLLTVY